MKTINYTDVHKKEHSHNIFDDVEEFIMFYDGKPPPLLEDWKLGQKGDWVLADDGKICEVIFRKDELPHPGDVGKYKYHKGYLRTIVMSAIINDSPSSKLHCDPTKHKSRYRFGNPKSYDQRSKIIARKNITKNERIFIFNLLHRRMTLEESYRDAYKKHIKSTGGSRILERALLLVKQERILAEIKKEVADAASKLGISHETVLGRIQQFADSDAVDPRVSLDAAKTLGKAIQTFEPKEIKQQITGGYGMAIEQIDEGDIKMIEDVSDIGAEQIEA